jgi:hypothetical protein
MKRHYMDALYVAGGGFTSHERKLRKAIRQLIKASDTLTAAIEGATDQFDAEKGALMDATSAAEKALKGGKR